MATVTGEWTGHLLSRASAGLGALVLGLLVALAGPAGYPDAGVVALATALVLTAALVLRSASFLPRPLRGAVARHGAVAACQVTLRDPDAPGRGARPRAPSRGPAPAR